jgi:chromosome segregation ATPase
MSNPIMTKLREPLPLTLAVVAVVGWVAFFVVWIASGVQQSNIQDQIAQIEGERDALVAQIGDREAADAELVALREEIETVSSERDTVTAEYDAVAAQLEETRARLDDANSESELASQQASDAEAALANAQEGLAQAEERLEQLTADISEGTASLADVGSRVQSARAEEAELRQTLVTLSEEAATNSARAADAETGRSTGANDRNAAPRGGIHPNAG